MADEEDNKLRYIGYSKSKGHWITIDPENINDTYDTYEFLNNGATALVYWNKNRIVKIIRGSEYIIDDRVFIRKCQKEINYQIKAASHELAPSVYHHGFVSKEKSVFFGLPYYYVIMDYLSELAGWKQIFADDNPPLFCEYINKLVDNAGLININDPNAHFFYNKKKKHLMMIDYGNCIECKEKMAETLGIKCSFDIRKRKASGPPSGPPSVSSSGSSSSSGGRKNSNKKIHFTRKLKHYKRK